MTEPNTVQTCDAVQTCDQAVGLSCQGWEMIARRPEVNLEVVAAAHGISLECAEQQVCLALGRIEARRAESVSAAGPRMGSLMTRLLRRDDGARSNFGRRLRAGL